MVNTVKDNQETSPVASPVASPIAGPVLTPSPVASPSDHDRKLAPPGKPSTDVKRFSQQQFQATVRHHMKNIIKANLIMNIMICPVTTDDIDRAEQIYGPSVPIIKGKTVRRTSSSVVSDYTAVPPEIMSDIFFINRARHIPLLMLVELVTRVTLWMNVSQPKEVIDRVNQLSAYYDSKGRLIGDDAELDDPIEGVIGDDEATPTDDAAPTVTTVNIQPNHPLIESHLVLKQKRDETQTTLSTKTTALLTTLMTTQLIFSTQMYLLTQAFPSWMIIWTNPFLEAQGYGTKETILCQDNQSAILLEKNGCKPGGKRTKHSNIRYYFITNRISRKELSATYCPTEEMIGDFFTKPLHGDFTKPLQGKLFYKFRSIIMNLKE
jgi:hypothetical protein